MDKPRVKPLVWYEYQAQNWKRGLVVGYAETPLGTDRETEIKRTPHGWTYGGAYYTANVGDIGSLNDALKEAKEAAQADYEARILAALEPVTVQEAARVLLGQWLSGSFEDTADAIADDAIISQWAHVDRTYPDANPIIESWLRALAEKGT